MIKQWNEYIYPSFIGVLIAINIINESQTVQRVEFKPFDLCYWSEGQCECQFLLKPKSEKRK